MIYGKSLSRQTRRHRYFPYIIFHFSFAIRLYTQHPISYTLLLIVLSDLRDQPDGRRNNFRRCHLARISRR